VCFLVVFGVGGVIWKVRKAAGDPRPKGEMWLGSIKNSNASPFWKDAKEGKPAREERNVAVAGVRAVYYRSRGGEGNAGRSEGESQGRASLLEKTALEVEAFT